jgi:CHAD domain-containing protein
MDALSKEVDRLSRQFLKLARGTAARSNSDHIHDLRVTTRRLRTLLGFTHAALPQGGMGKVRRHLKKLSQRLGECRMYDVAIADAKSISLNSQDLKRRRKKSRRRCQKFLTGKKGKALARHLPNLGHRLRRETRVSFGVPLEAMHRTLSEAIVHPPRTNTTRHELRIKVKQVRYVLDTLSHVPKGLAQLQDALGRKHDWEVLQHLLGPNKKARRLERQELKKAQDMMDTVLRKADVKIERLRRGRRLGNRAVNEIHHDHGDGHRPHDHVA